MVMPKIVAPKIVNNQQGFTLVELIIVIVLISILAVTAGPRIFGSGGVDQVVAERQLLSLLRLQQQQAMQDVANPCYGVSFTASQISPFACGAPVTSQRIISLPPANALSVVSSIPAAAIELRFNGLGCPVSQGHATTPESCGQSNVELQITGANARSICIQSQGYIRVGSCS